MQHFNALMMTPVATLYAWFLFFGAPWTPVTEDTSAVEIYGWYYYYKTFTVYIKLYIFSKSIHAEKQMHYEKYLITISW